jgi:copper homeostasis protein
VRPNAREATMEVTVVEAAVESVDEVLAAERGGAHRLELCARLDVGGVTASPAAYRLVRKNASLPIAMMVRPRAPSFIYSLSDLDAARRHLDGAIKLGADMIVFGALDANARVDEKATREVVQRAGKTPVTFHRAFDHVADQMEALDVLIGAGVSRVLTSGGAATAEEGIEALARLVERAADRIVIMAGGKVRGHNVRAIVEGSGVREVHARCTDVSVVRGIVDALA